MPSFLGSGVPEYPAVDIWQPYVAGTQDPLKNSAPVPDSYLVMESYPVHDPRATWRSGWGRRFVLLLGWSAALTAVGGLFAAGHVGALWAWAISPAAAGFAAFTIVVMPEPRPAAAPKPVPKYLVADQRINLLTAVPEPAAEPTAHPVPRTISSRRAPRRLAVPQRQAA